VEWGSHGRSCVDEWIVSSLAPLQTLASKVRSEPLFPRSAATALTVRLKTPGRSSGQAPFWARQCQAPSRGRSRAPWQ
jgi:hypothetical protein